MTEPRTDLLEPYEGFGKYEGEMKLTEVLDGLDADEETGDVEATGRYRLYVFNDDDFNGPTAPYVAAILRTSGDGFVTAEYYESKEEAVRVWARVEVATTEADDETEAE